MNWLYVAAGMSLIWGGAFVYCLLQRKWDKAALGVGLANIFIAFLHSVAPIRGWADPEYAGFSFNFIEVAPGPMVTLVTGSIFILATYSACAALLKLKGRPMMVLFGFDALIALNVLGGIVGDLIMNGAEDARIRLGEYLTLGPVPTITIMVLVMAVPLVLSCKWAYGRFELNNQETAEV